MQIAQSHASHVDQLNWSALQNIKPQLATLFGSPELLAAPSTLEAIHEKLPGCTVIGCSTAGEIAQTYVHEKSLVLTAIHFTQPSFVSSAVSIDNMDDSQAAGARLAQSLLEKLQGKQPDSVMIFAPGVNINGSALIAGLSQTLPPNTPITGGLAGDNGAFTQTWTVLNQQASDRQLVALAFYDDQIQLHHGSFGGWQPFGPARRVTRCTGNELFELDGEPALEVYKRYLGEHAAKLPASGLLFPFEMLEADHSKTGLIRTILAVDHEKGSLILAGDIELNGYLKLMHASTDALIDGAEAAADAAHQAQKQNGASFGLLVSCVGRRLVMGDRVDEEVEAVAEVFGQDCTLTGFYSYGEISPFFDSPECKLHNQTMTISLLTEK